MKKSLFLAPGTTLLAVLALFLLSACGKSLETPESVMAKAQEALTTIKSGYLEVTAQAKGQNGTDDLMFKGDLELNFDSRDNNNQKMDLHAALEGDMKANEKTLNGELDFQFITIQKEYFLKLNKLVSSDGSLDGAQMFIDLYKGKWLRIAEDFIPENIRNLQEEDEASKLRQKQLKDLFVETNLFDVVKEFGVKKVNGRKAYHYGVKPNMNGFKDYMTKAAMIDGRQMTAQELEEAIKILSYVRNAELYIDADDYFVLKSVFQFAGVALSDETDADLEVDVTIEGSGYNKSVAVKAPDNSEDFNPLSLIMLLGGMMPSMDEAGLTEDGFEFEPADETEIEAEVEEFLEDEATEEVTE